MQEYEWLLNFLDNQSEIISQSRSSQLRELLTDELPLEAYGKYFEIRLVLATSATDLLVTREHNGFVLRGTNTKPLLIPPRRAVREFQDVFGV